MYFMSRLESTGEPGRVHISAKTYAFLVEDYFVQPGEKFKGIIGLTLNWSEFHFLYFQSELGSFEGWILGLMLDPLCILISNSQD